MNDYVLIYYSADEGEKRFELELDRSYRLGSKNNNDVVVPQNDVSRNHAILRVSDGVFHVTDLKSKNGTFINGNRTASARFRAGDLLNLSSAQFVVVEAGSSDFLVQSDKDPKSSKRSLSTSDTVQRKIRASSEDLVALLDLTAKATPRGALAEPLAWGISKLGLEAVLVLFRNRDGMVSIVSSAGDLGPLIARSEALGDLARNPKLEKGSSPHIRHFHEVGEDILVAPLHDAHLMIIRYSGSPPAVGDIQALASAAELVLHALASAAAVEERDSADIASAETGDIRTFDCDAVVDMSLQDARSTFERWLITQVLERCNGNQSLAARELSVSRAGLFKKVRKLGL